MKVLVSFNGGGTEWQTRQAPLPQGDVAGFAVPLGGFGVITIAVVPPGLDTIYRSANLGQSWSTFGIQGTSGGAALSSLQFMRPVIRASAGQVERMTTRAAGERSRDQGPGGP
jgi:hypothetical protein